MAGGGKERGAGRGAASPRAAAPSPPHSWTRKQERDDPSAPARTLQCDMVSSLLPGCPFWTPHADPLNKGTHGVLKALVMINFTVILAGSGPPFQSCPADAMLCDLGRPARPLWAPAASSAAIRGAPRGGKGAAMSISEQGSH